MANILDIRRRIRSVTNTRQITRAMKMVSAARLRRAQERALAARPYAQMLTNVLKSLVSRADIFDPDTGELLHPLLVRRPEQNVLLLIVTGDKGLAGAFNANILKAAMRFIESKSGKNIELETIGRKGSGEQSSLSCFGSSATPERSAERFWSLKISLPRVRAARRAAPSSGPRRNIPTSEPSSS